MNFAWRFNEDFKLSIYSDIRVEVRRGFQQKLFRLYRSQQVTGTHKMDHQVHVCQTLHQKLNEVRCWFFPRVFLRIACELVHWWTPPRPLLQKVHARRTVLCVASAECTIFCTGHEANTGYWILLKWPTLNSIAFLYVYFKYTINMRGTSGSLKQTLDCTSTFTISQHDEKWSMGLLLIGLSVVTGTFV